MSLVTTEALDFTDGNSFDADGVQGIFNFIKLERFYNCFDKFHWETSYVSSIWLLELLEKDGNGRHPPPPPDHRRNS
jgi:hypothetical protein